MPASFSVGFSVFNERAEPTSGAAFAGSREDAAAFCALLLKRQHQGADRRLCALRTVGGPARG
jgi:hypothetical protein